MLRIVCDIGSKSLWFGELYILRMCRCPFVHKYCISSGRITSSTFRANQRPRMSTLNCFSHSSSRFLWEALVYGSEEGPLSVVSRSPVSGVLNCAMLHYSNVLNATASVQWRYRPDARGLNPAAGLYISGRNQWRRMTRRQRADSCALLRRSHVWQEGERVGSHRMAVMLWKGRERESKIQMAL